MSARTATFIASRFFAVYLVVTYVLGYGVQLVSALIVSQTEADSQTLAYAGSLTFATVLYTLTAMAFWFHAGRVADIVVKPEPHTSDEGLNIDQWKALVVAMIGAICVLKGLQFLSGTVKIIRSQDNASEDGLLFYTIATTVFYLLAGIGLIVWPSIAKAVKALLSWFGKPAFHEDEQ